MAGNLSYNSIDAVGWFRVKILESSNEAVKKSQQQAVDSFNKFIGEIPVRFEALNETFIAEWVSWMFYQGYSHATVMTYVGRLSALYGKAVKEKVTDDCGGFSIIKERLKKASPLSGEINSIPDCFDRVRRIVQMDCSSSPFRQFAKDLVLFSLYNGGLSFEKLAKYRKNEYLGDDEAVLEIINRYSRPKNKYLFPLNQSERTSNQLAQAISDLFSEVLRLVGIKLSSYTSTTPVDLWAMAAMHSNISIADIASCIDDTNTTNPLYSFAVRLEISRDRKYQILSCVRRALSHNPENWYAMQFRPQVDYDKIQTRLKLHGITFSKFFYPMEEIVKRIGKKLKKESKPVVPGLLFFKYKPTELSELFHHIGDLAWGYRYSRTNNSSYAIIREKEIEKYQKATGEFVDGIDEYPQGTLYIEEGDTVKITDGDYSGYTAIFEKEIREKVDGDNIATKIIYRLRLIGLQNFSWVVDLDPRQIAKISD